MRTFEIYGSYDGFEYLTLSLANSPTANLLIGTTSGNGFQVEWGDGVWVNYTNNQNVTKTYGSNFTGNIRVRTLLGLGDITRFEINNATNKYTFDLSALSGLVNLSFLRLFSVGSAFSGNLSSLSGKPLKTLYLYSNSATWNGNFSVLTGMSLTSFSLQSTTATWSGSLSVFNPMPLTSFSINSNSSSFYANINFLAQKALTILNVVSINADINYSVSTWISIPNMVLRPKAASFTSAMTDQLLIDLSTATIPDFTGKTIDLRGNCGAKTAASNGAVAIITGGGGIVLTN